MRAPSLRRFGPLSPARGEFAPFPITPTEGVPAAPTAPTAPTGFALLTLGSAYLTLNSLYLMVPTDG